MKLKNTPLVELRVEQDASGNWRKVVAQEGITLHNLHRLVQISFTNADATIEGTKYSFTLRGAKLGRLKGTVLTAEAVGEAFLSGQEALKYVAGGCGAGAGAYTISAGQRARGDAKYYVPRCIAGSGEAALDDINEKLLLSRFGRNSTHNKMKKDPPPMRAFDDTPDYILWGCYLKTMRKPVDWDPVAEVLAEYDENRAENIAPQQPPPPPPQQH